jgi:tRNA(Ile)-lysidine synthase
LRWIEDPSNDDIALDRNFLRHRVLPLLRERWPHADAAFARSAALNADASGLLAAHDEALLTSVRGESSSALSVPALRMLPAAQRARVLRRWVAALGLPPLPAKGVARIEADLLDTGSGGPVDGRTPRFAWRNVEIRRWRDALHAIDTGRELPPAWSCLWDGREPLALPNGGSLVLAGAESFAAPLEAHARRGGERILLPGRDGHHRTLKHLLQDSGIPPWERAGMPLLSTADGILLAAGNGIHSAGFEQWLESRNARLVWNRC